MSLHTALYSHKCPGEVTLPQPPALTRQVAVEEPSAEVVDVLEEGSAPEQDEEQQLGEVLERITQRLQALEAQLEQEG